MELPLKFSADEKLIAKPISKTVSENPKVMIIRAETNKGVVFNFEAHEDGKLIVSSNFGFNLNTDTQELSTNFDKPNPDFLDKF